MAHAHWSPVLVKLWLGFTFTWSAFYVVLWYSEPTLPDVLSAVINSAVFIVPPALLYGVFGVAQWIYRAIRRPS